MELNRPRRSLPADLPPELWAVIGLLCVAGLFTGIPVLQHLGDAFELITDGGLWDSFGLLVLVLYLELGFFAVLCFLLARLLSQGDPVARVVTVVVSGSLAVGLLVGSGLDDGSATVTVLCSIAAVACLVAPPRVREFLADRAPGAVAPTGVVAAGALVVMLGAILVAVGVAYLPVMSVRAKFGFAGLALAGIGIVCLKDRRRLPTGDPAARTQVSGLMAGAVLAILLGNEGSLTGPLFIPLAMAVAVVGLLWVPPDIQAFFAAGRSLDVDAADREDDSGFAPLPPAPLPRTRSVPMSPRPPLGPEPEPRSPPPPPAPVAPRAPLAPFDPGPAPSSASRSSPYAPAPPSLPPSVPRPVESDPTVGPSPPRPTAPPVAGRIATPPGWLLDAPPAGFWPPERRRADPRRYQVIDVVPSGPDELQVAPDLGIRFDTASWFPVLEGREQVRGAYLVSMAMFDDATAGTAFRGTSTLLVTSARLVGVCARGDSAAGPLDPGAGRVAVWRVLLDQVDWVRAEGSAEGGHLALKGWDAERPWALLAKPRVAVEGAFRPSALSDLAEVVNRAKHTSG